MSLSVHQKQRIDILKEECNMLWNVALNLWKDTLSTASNNRVSDNSAWADLREDETIDQLKEQTDIEQQNSPPSNISQEEATNNLVFH